MAQLHLIRGATTSDETFTAVAAEAQRLGFEFCSFGMKAPVPLAAPRVMWCSNYPEAWKRRYEAQNYLLQDPTVRHAITSDAPILWTDELFTSCPQLRLEAQEHGLNHGWAQPRRDLHGNVSLLSFVRREPVINADEIAVKQARLQWLSCLCHEGMLKVWGARLIGNIDNDALSDRELDVLRWSCDGKTSADIAVILSISEATVNFHVRNACAKLGTSSKTAAAVRAALLGLLW
ncbi:autoinducer binding domain-containing protein [Piscinibacter sp.]|uniref:autoinducer binding domain-containing protein n=1 Tax=Piscinibacter sp. TaxID=1903157 RepID=UPI0039E6246D